MLGHYGWILPFGDINLPMAMAKTGGRVYVHQNDVTGPKLATGDVVSFYLYFDHQGLGAECCKLEKRAAPSMNVNAAEFEPAVCVADDSEPEFGDSCLTASWNIGATEFVPSSVVSCFSPEAAEFVPSAIAPEFVPSAAAPEFVPTALSAQTFVKNANVLSINPAFWSDDESDDESSTLGEDELVCCNGSIGDSESTISTVDKDFRFEGSSKWADDIEAVVLHAPLKSPRASSVDDSTSAGESSDSEAEDSFIAKNASKWQNLPSGFRPPPGLSLPGFEEE